MMRLAIGSPEQVEAPRRSGSTLVRRHRGRSSQFRDGWPSQGYWTAVVFLPVPPPAIVKHKLLFMFTSWNVRLSLDVMRQLRDGSPSQV
jgi:hypothetical protein